MKEGLTTGLVESENRGDVVSVQAILQEVRRARQHHKADIVSVHEAYAIILEEVDELWDECRKKTQNRKPEDVALELVQIGAMAVRALTDLGLDKLIVGRT